jgi:hypothetical protein
MSDNPRAALKPKSSHQRSQPSINSCQHWVTRLTTFTTTLMKNTPLVQGNATVLLADMSACNLPPPPPHTQQHMSLDMLHCNSDQHRAICSVTVAAALLTPARAVPQAASCRCAAPITASGMSCSSVLPRNMSCTETQWHSSMESYPLKPTVLVALTSLAWQCQ